MPTKISIDIYLDKATIPQLIPPSKLNEVFLLKLPHQKKETLLKQPLKPYSISFPRYFYNSGEIITSFSVEISTIDDTLLEYFLEVFSMPPESILLGDVYINKIKIKHLQEEDFEDLLQNNEHTDEILLDFITPTILEKKNVEFPIPDYIEIFKDALLKWNKYSKKKITLENDWILKYLQVSSLFVRTMHVEMPNFPIKIGFTGKIFLNITTKSKVEINKLLALKRFMEYSSVGKYTHLSFGKVVAM